MNKWKDLCFYVSISSTQLSCNNCFPGGNAVQSLNNLITVLFRALASPFCICRVDFNTVKIIFVFPLNLLAILRSHWLLHCYILSNDVCLKDVLNQTAISTLIRGSLWRHNISWKLPFMILKEPDYLWWPPANFLLCF